MARHKKMGRTRSDDPRTAEFLTTMDINVLRTLSLFKAGVAIDHEKIVEHGDATRCATNR